jgi:4-diphosphocytidyl-2-C-methyl-D-erythritol kinase
MSPSQNREPLRKARVRALAKLNLDLRVLGKRADGYHELRTIFQTIALADTIEIGFTPGRKTEIELEDRLAIENNLVTRAANAAMQAMRATGRVQMRLTKRIPMGAGLGGGSSDAAAVLLALPALAGYRIEPEKLVQIAQELGSDVPFFLLGGRAVGLGRGTELMPLDDNLKHVATEGLLIAPDVHVETAQAYRDLSPRLTTESQENKIFSFQSQVWGWGVATSPVNDFETVVFEQHRSLASLKKRLLRAGASVALMTGSGSAVYGLFSGRKRLLDAMRQFRNEKVFRVSLVSRARYQAMWWRALGEHIKQKTWPPQSRYAR